MKEITCDKEELVLEALSQGCAPEDFDAPLRAHLNDCPSCAELIYIHELFRKDREQLWAAAPLPEAGRVWWRAAAERALRPIMTVERIALGAGGGALIALIIFAALWASRQLARLAAYLVAAVNAFPMGSLLVTCLTASFALLLAGGLYALWSEK